MGRAKDARKDGHEDAAVSRSWHARWSGIDQNVTLIFLPSLLGLMLLIGSCGTDRTPGLAGIYQTWDDVVTRWIGRQKADLYLELGPPQFHKQSGDGMEELVWDMTLPSLPGQAEIYGTLPLYGGVDCRLFFFADPEGLIRAGHRDGCD
jgi:hypothetical protein